MICDVTDTRGENNTNTKTRRVTQRLRKTQDWYRGGFERESNHHDAQLVGWVACVPSTICARNHEKNHPGTAALMCVRCCVCVRTSMRTRGGFWRCTENVWTLAAERVFLVPPQKWCSSSRQMHCVCIRSPGTFPNSTPQGFGKDLVTIDDALLSTPQAKRGTQHPRQHKDMSLTHVSRLMETNFATPLE